MNKLLWLRGIVAFAVVSCTEGNRDSIKKKDTLNVYDSVLIGRDPGFSCGLTEVYWMLYKNRNVTKYTRSIFASDGGKDAVRTVRSSDDSVCCVQKLADDMFIKGIVKDIVTVKGDERCSDMGGLYICICYHGKTVRYECNWGQTGVKYSSEFNELMNLLKVHDAE